VTTHTLGSATDYEENFLDTPLGDLGVSRLEIMEARGQNGASLYLELTGDLKKTLE
jgi:hypothetical protein